MYLSPTPVSQIRLHSSNQVGLRIKTKMNKTFDTIILATTATAVQLIDFRPRIDSIYKYRLFQIYLISAHNSDIQPACTFCLY